MPLFLSGMSPYNLSSPFLDGFSSTGQTPLVRIPITDGKYGKMRTVKTTRSVLPSAGKMEDSDAPQCHVGK